MGKAGVFDDLDAAVHGHPADRARVMYRPLCPATRLLLNRTPPILSNGRYLPLIVSATLVVGLVRARISRLVLVDRTVRVIDAVGIPVFAIVGMQLSLNAGVPARGVVLVGVVNGIGGGLLRDLLVGDTPAILIPGQYPSRR